MNEMAGLASTINGSAALSVGDGITGVMVAHKDPTDIEAVSFAYASPNESINVGAFTFIWPSLMCACHQKNSHV